MSHRYEPVGECIYCGTKEPPLDLEHIIPLSMGGNLLLPEASCRCCARIINEQVENPITTGEWGDLRAKLKFPTRRKKKRKPRTHARIGTVFGTVKEIPLSDHYTPVPLYRFKEARILSGLPQDNPNFHFTMDILQDDGELKAMMAKHPEWNRKLALLPRPDRFARFLANIAHAYATAELGMGTFNPLTKDLILGRTVDYPHTVGGLWEIQPEVPDGDHLTGIRMLFASATLARVIVDIRLFSKIRMPSYHVVVGEIDFHRPEHVAAFEQHRVNGKIVSAPLNVRQIMPSEPVIGRVKLLDSLEQSRRQSPSGGLPGLPGSGIPYTRPAHVGNPSDSAPSTQSVVRPVTPNDK